MLIVDTALKKRESENNPIKVGVIGAGYIATEIAGLLQGLGSDVSMLLRKDRLLRSFDPVIYETITEQMVNSGVNIMTNVALKQLARNQNGTLGFVDETDQQQGEYDFIIWAIGR